MVPSRCLAVSLTILVLVAAVALGPSAPTTVQAPAQAADDVQAGADLAARMNEAVARFLASLPPEQRSRANLANEHPQRLVWHYYPRVPWDRTGVTLKELSAEQKQRFLDVVRVGTSADGYQTAINLMQLEAILRDIENTPTARELRDPERFHLTIFGKPGPKGRWSWKLEGHHLILHYVIQDGQVVAATPFVFGANPGRVPSGLKRGWRILPRQEDVGRQLYTSLGPTARRKARFIDEPPFDVLTNVDTPAKRLPALGLAHAEMDGAQQKLLRELLEVYTGLLPKVVQERLLREIVAAGMDQVRFAWSGAAEPGKPHYYQVNGPRFVVEYCNSQNYGNHIHVVWRDYHSDFGEKWAK